MLQHNILIFKYYLKDLITSLCSKSKNWLFKFLYYIIKGNEHKVWHNKVKPKFAGSYLYMLKTQIFNFVLKTLF